MVGGRVLFSDSTHFKASANKHQFKKETVSVETRDYIEELNEAIKRIFGVIAHRRYHPVRGLFPKWKFEYDKVNDCYTCPSGKILPYRI